MPVELLTRLRDLRKKSQDLAATIVEDHRPFQHDGKPLFYFRLPSRSPKTTDAVSVTPTCTAWMALCTARVYSTLYKLQPSDKVKAKADAANAYSQLLKEPWDTGGLKQNNAFTVAVVARAVGLMVDDEHLDVGEVNSQTRTREDKEKDSSDIKDKWRKCQGKTLKTILQGFLENADKAIALEPFPASPTIGYWMIDAASRLSVELDIEPAKSLAAWAAAEFRRQHSLVAAAEQAMMDPIALAMAACMCKALGRIAGKLPVYYEAMKASLFPSDGELEAGIREFFGKQNSQSGVWEKYFPIFHYPDSGPNHCWHFEVLEAVVSEFPNILNDAEVLQRLNMSLKWLEINRVAFRHNKKPFSGWNAGGDIQAMRRGEPESWPTGVAHMFLARLNDQLSACIQGTLLEKFGDRVRVWPKDKDADKDFPQGKKWITFLDSEFLDYNKCGLVESRNSVKKMIEKEILEPAEKNVREHPLSPHLQLTDRHSAVLFGPPGTSKTSLCEAISKRLGWHFVELSPSDFLGGGLDGIYNKVSEIFDDLQDLYGVVTLFDEMDALVQSRDPTGKAVAGPLDVTQQLLTTSMLPKLQRLHKGARSLFFMATNYIGTFDGAIIRSGRFDLLIHMGPPSTSAKIDGLAQWCQDDGETEIEKAQELLRTVLIDDAKERFDRFTFGEAGRFFYSLRLKKGGVSTAMAIQNTDALEIKQQIKEWAESKITLNDRTKTKGALADYKKDAERVCIQ